MSEENIQETIDSYKKRQQRAPFLIGGLAVVLLISGLFIMAYWMTGPNPPNLAFLSTETPTPTDTPTATAVPPTPTATEPVPTATETLTPTPSPTETPSGPFIYVVQEGDSCFSIAEQFNVELVLLLEINDLPSDCPLFVGTELVVPPPGTVADTPTPLPSDFFGQIEYRVQEGDSLDGIAIRFNSTVESIIELNEDLDNPNEIFIGQILVIQVNIVTPGPTLPPESQQTPGAILTFTPTP